MFGAKQVQTLDVDKIMEQILENHDAKVIVDKLIETLNRELENELASRNDDEEIKKMQTKATVGVTKTFSITSAFPAKS